MSKRVEVADLTQFCGDVLTVAGLRVEDANTVADVLVMTDTWGTHSHGTGALLNYVRSLQAGGMDRNARPEVISEGGSWAVVDAHHGMGMPSSCMAMDLAIQKARSATISWTGVRNSNHFGAAGFYANMAARANMIGISMSSADPNMTIPGSRGHTIGNNPFAYAVPTGNDRPILLDIALSAVAWGKIMAMKKSGLTIPPNWITGADGQPTGDLDNWPATGSMMPMAGHKGYGLAVMVEVLSSLLSGAGLLDEMTSWVMSPGQNAHLGHAFIAINISDILPFENFCDRAAGFVRKIHGSPKAQGSDRVYLPGEIEWEKREEALALGIALPELVLNNLHQAGIEVGVQPPPWTETQGTTHASS